MPHPGNTTHHDTNHYYSDQYDSNDDKDYSNFDSEINEGVWRFMKTPRQANLAFNLNAVYSTTSKKKLTSLLVEF